MKLNELMVGDFVFHEKYGNAIIEIINNDFEDNPSVEIISENIKHKDGYKYGYCWCDLDEIFPIPLTPEILEKNGFTKEYGVWVIYRHPSFKWFVLYKREFGYTISVGESEVSIDNAHELQHVLKLCGIEKTIEL